LGIMEEAAFNTYTRKWCSCSVLDIILVIYKECSWLKCYLALSTGFFG
jgi:hypothetical protein